jgi:putative membrane-bound dehydrogenase-like protein
MLRRSLLTIALVSLVTNSFAAEKPAFPPIVDNQPGTPLAANDTLAKWQLPPGFKVELFASEPQVQQPIGITIDPRGRLWIAECYTYADRDKNFDLSMRDRVVILEDSDGDGRCDKRTVFWDQAQKLTSVEVGLGGVWVLCAPQLLFIPDRDGDDVPDGPPEVVLDGFDSNTIRHNIVNGLKWGPDGWLYGRHGIQATSLVGKPGASESQRTKLNCSIWRYHPIRRDFEVVCQGGTNSWGFDYDRHGEMFYINTVIGHLWHVVPGAHYRRMYGVHFNPHLYQYIEQCADHFHWDTREVWSDIRKEKSDSTDAAGGGHAHCGMLIYQGTNWPEEYRGNVFTVNLHGHRLNRDRLERHGAGFVAKHAPDFAKSGDEWFRGIELVTGPDGGVFVIDWSDIGECHENDGVHRSTGRIYKITHGSIKPRPALNLYDMASDNLVLNGIATDNEWFARTARQVIYDRATSGQEVHEQLGVLREKFASNQLDATGRLRALWLMNVIAEVPEPWLIEQLADADEHVRIWCIRLLADRRELSPAAIKALGQLALRESSGLVHLYLASILQRVPLADRWPIARAIATHAEWSSDNMLPLMVWYAIEPAVTVAPTQALDLFSICELPVVRKHIARRLTGAIDTQPAAVDALIARAATEKNEARLLDLLQGMTDALRGWQKAPVPAAWSSASATLAKHEQPEVQRLVRELSVVFGDGRALDDLRKIVVDAQADAAVRRSALAALVTAKADDFAPTLQKLLNDRALVIDAVRGLAAYDDAKSPEQILNVYARLSPEGRAEAVNTLTSRPAYAIALLDALEKGRLQRSDIGAFHARQMLSFNQPQLSERLGKLWGEVRATPQARRDEMERLKAQLTTERLAKADRVAGKATFTKTCANCHVLFGQGKKVGPDLTGGNRKNLDYLLENILDPSATVAADFRMSVYQLADGRVISGVVIEQTDRTITVQSQTTPVTIDRKEIEATQASNQSLMAEGILKPFSEQQIAELIAYLQSNGD